MNDKILVLENLSKTYGKHKALKGVNYVFGCGIYGILGANGAGKSTMINLITDNISRDKGDAAGRVLYNGEDILRLGSSFRALIGYMPQQQGFYEDFTPRSFLKYMAEIKGIKKKETQKQIGELLEVVNLCNVADKKIGGFSGGMRQRVMLAQALLGKPEILIMDEPTVGLDPKERIAFRNYVSKLSRDRIVLIATHIVSDIEYIADHVLLMNSGEIVKTGTPSELIESMKGKVCEYICGEKELPCIQKEFRTGNIRPCDEGYKLRIVGDNLPQNSIRVNEGIDLEDVYLYYVGDNSD